MGDFPEIRHDDACTPERLLPLRPRGLCRCPAVFIHEKFAIRANNFEGVLYALLAGMCSSLGGMLFLRALGRGEAAVVITFTALYPVVTIILSFVLLHETITMKQGAGIVLAVLAMVLLL